MLSFLTPWVKRLIVANVIVFAAQNFVPGLTNLLAFEPLFAFMHPWTIITYMFVHGGMWHILFNMVTLGFFGPRVEAQLGGRQFLALYFISGLGGAVLSYFTTPAGIIGASGAIFGVELAFAIFWPRERIFIWGVLPLEARWLVVLDDALLVMGRARNGRRRHRPLRSPRRLSRRLSVSPMDRLPVAPPRIPAEAGDGDLREARARARRRR